MTWRPQKKGKRKSKLNEQAIRFAGKNRYDVLTIDKTKDISDSFFIFSPCQEASSACLEHSWDFSVVLDSSFQT